jgi:hypothetical protein
MQPAHRLLSAVFAIIAIVFAGIVLALALGWAIPQAYLLSFLTVADNRWIIGAISALVIVLALYLIISAGKSTHHHRELTIQDTSYGRVDISVPALEDMIRRASRQVREIREIRPLLHYENGAVAVDLRLNVSPEANLPAVSHEVQAAVQQYLEEKAGIQVRQVQVLIEGVSFESRTRVE